MERQLRVRVNESLEILQTINNNALDIHNDVDKLENEIVNLKFEKESYTQHLNILSDWFVLFVSVLFGIFFIVGYRTLENVFKRQAEEIKDSYLKQEELYTHFKLEFSDVKENMYVSMANISTLIGLTYQKFQYNYIYHTAMASYNYGKAYEFTKNKSYLKSCKFRIVEVTSCIKLKNLGDDYNINDEDDIQSLTKMVRHLKEISNLDNEISICVSQILTNLNLYIPDFKNKI